MDFSSRLKSLRKSRNHTQKDVYDAINVAPIVYQRYEYGKNLPRVEQLIALADYFDTSIDYLVGRTDDPTPPVPPIQQSMSERG